MAVYSTPYGNKAAREVRVLLSESQNHRCCYCGLVMFDPHYDGSSVRNTCGAVTIEHIIPRSRGGTDDWENLAAACSQCNGERGSEMMAIAFYYKRATQPRKERPARGAAQAPGKKRRPNQLAIARDVSGNPIIETPPKSLAYLSMTLAIHAPCANVSKQKKAIASGEYAKITNRQRRKAMLAMVGHDLAFGSNRLPSAPVCVPPIEGATLGTLWPKAS